MKIAKSIPRNINYKRIFTRLIPSKNSSCIEWGGHIGKRGYGVLSLTLPNGKISHYTVHRIIYRIYYGSLNSRLVIDHICRNRKCVNPKHLRQVTRNINSSENSTSPPAINKLKRYCKRGHKFTIKNTHRNKEGNRACKECAKFFNHRSDILKTFKRLSNA